jgi:hypothetical protein
MLGGSMIDVESYGLNALDCLRQAGNEETAEDKNILLNVALAWLRLAQQTQQMDLPAMEPQPADLEAIEPAEPDQDELAASQ